MIKNEFCIIYALNLRVEYAQKSVVCIEVFAHCVMSNQINIKFI